MPDAKRDSNYVPTLLAVSSVDGTTPVVLYADPATHRLYVDLPVNGSGTPITATTNAVTVPINPRVTTVINDSAAALTITITTTNAVDGQAVIVRILDFSAVSQSITWVNTENSNISTPTATNGSTTLPLTVGFMYNANTSKWRCLASA